MALSGRVSSSRRGRAERADGLITTNTKGTKRTKRTLFSSSRLTLHELTAEYEDAKRGRDEGQIILHQHTFVLILVTFVPSS